MRVNVLAISTDITSDASVLPASTKLYTHTHTHTHTAQCQIKAEYPSIRGSKCSSEDSLLDVRHLALKRRGQIERHSRANSLL